MSWWDPSEMKLGHYLYYLVICNQSLGRMHGIFRTVGKFGGGCVAADGGAVYDSGATPGQMTNLVSASRSHFRLCRLNPSWICGLSDPLSRAAT